MRLLWTRALFLYKPTQIGYFSEVCNQVKSIPSCSVKKKSLIENGEWEELFYINSLAMKDNLGVELWMNPLEAFPFKKMGVIVDLIADGEVNVSKIRAETGLCSFDSTEVSDMLAFLTSFGCVEAQGDGWIIQKADEESTYGRFRKAFLKDAVAVLTQLSGEEQTVEQISKETGLPNEKVKPYLPFLAEITRLGVISRCSMEYPVAWCQISE